MYPNRIFGEFSNFNIFESSNEADRNERLPCLSPFSSRHLVFVLKDIFADCNVTIFTLLLMWCLKFEFFERGELANIFSREDSATEFFIALTLTRFLFEGQMEYPLREKRGAVVALAR